MSFLQRSWVGNWRRWFTETQLGKSKAGNLKFYTHINIETQVLSHFQSWPDEISFYFMNSIGDAYLMFSRTKCSFFLSVQQKQSLSSHSSTLLPSLISPKISRSSFCKSEQQVSSFFTSSSPTTLIILLLSCCFTACKLITRKTASRGTLWPRGSWMLQAQVRSCRQPKAVRPISTAGKSAVARFTKRESALLTLVGVTDSATAEFAQFLLKAY